MAELEELKGNIRGGDVIVPFASAPKTPAEAAKGCRTITMEFPTKVHLTIATNHTVFYPVGTHEVPEHLASHWYLKANGARPYAKPLAVGELQKPQSNGKGARK
jgi:hypothetical protein